VRRERKVGRASIKHLPHDGSFFEVGGVRGGRNVERALVNHLFFEVGGGTRRREVERTFVNHIPT
jgi:hypothetical protein